MFKKPLILMLSFVLLFTSLILPGVAEAKRVKKVTHSKSKKNLVSKKNAKSHKVAKNKKASSSKKNIASAKLRKKHPGRRIASIAPHKSIKKNVKNKRNYSAKVKKKRNLPKEYGTI